MAIIAKGDVYRGYNLSFIVLHSGNFFFFAPILRLEINVLTMAAIAQSSRLLSIVQLSSDSVQYSEKKSIRSVQLDFVTRLNLINFQQLMRFLRWRGKNVSNIVKNLAY